MWHLYIEILIETCLIAGISLVFFGRLRRRFGPELGGLKVLSPGKWVAKGLEGARERLKAKRFKGELDREICEAISFVRNVVSIDMGRNTSLDYVLEHLSRRRGQLQDVFIKALSYLRMDRKKEAGELLESCACTSIGREFTGLLLKWDDMDPGDFDEILLSHQRGIRQMQLTAARKRDEAISDLVYLPVVANAILVFVNFIYVAYFMEQKAMLRQLLV